MSDSPWFSWRGATLLLRLALQPGAKRDEFVGPHGDALKVRVHAPARENRANESLVEFLAAAFDTPRADVQLLRGASGRRKMVAIDAPRRIPAVLQSLGLRALSGEARKSI